MSAEVIIRVRPVGRWVNVDAKIDGTGTELGLHNRAEVESLAEILRSAASELEHWIDVVDPRSKCSYCGEPLHEPTEKGRADE